MGTALGDSIGLPFEALSRKKIAKKGILHPHITIRKVSNIKEQIKD